jgi:hypothetical protein
LATMSFDSTPSSFANCEMRLPAKCRSARLRLPISIQLAGMRPTSGGRPGGGGGRGGWWGRCRSTRRWRTPCG